jgi:hypothetical protein
MMVLKFPRTEALPRFGRLSHYSICHHSICHRGDICSRSREEEAEPALKDQGSQLAAPSQRGNNVIRFRKR